MILREKEMTIPAAPRGTGLLEYVCEAVLERVPSDGIPIRFAVTQSDKNYHCELGVLEDLGTARVKVPPRSMIFDFNKRNYENVNEFNAVLLIPTGIGADIGGHSGDAGPIARLLASSCDHLITHPNVVNAADINELPENGLYVEGSVITRLLMGTIGLQRVRSNRVVLIIDKHENKFFYEAAVNAVSAARAAFGLECPEVVLMEDKVAMHSLYSSSGRAVGKVDHFERICEILSDKRQIYDAVALSSVIRVPKRFHVDYYFDDTVNPWGGVEAMLTHAISILFNIPSAHSPMLESREILDLDLGIIDPRKAAEIISVTFLHSILKGLHRSPRIVSAPRQYHQPGVLTVSDISCLVIPNGCIGLPTLAALEQRIPVIAVKENRNRMQNKLEQLPFEPGKLFVVENYWEAVGVMTAIKAGVAPASVRRPLSYTSISEFQECKETLSVGYVESPELHIDRVINLESGLPLQHRKSAK